MKNTLSDYIVILLSVLGGLGTTIAYGLYIAPLLNDQGLIGVLFLGLIGIFFIGYSFYLISKHRDRTRYADIFEELNVGFSKLHIIDRHSSPSIELIIRNLSSFCDHLSTVFTAINGDRICVCIKFLTFKNGRPIVMTLVRDSYSKNKNRKTGSSDKTEHFIELNSDFQFIWDNFDNDNVETSYYHEPNLPICKDYKNSRLSTNWKGRMKFKFLDNFWRRKQWPLPYRSTLVLPIVPLLADEQTQKTIRGFLCLDSAQEGKFNPRIDVEILKGVSDALYNKIDKLNQLIKESNEQA